MDCSPPGSSVNEILQAIIEEQVAISSSKDFPDRGVEAVSSTSPALAGGRRKWQPTPVFLPGESYGQRGLVGYSSWGHKESDTTE